MPDYHLAIRCEGTGPPLVFLHALGASSRYWSGRLGALTATHRCVLPDLLGFGQSPKPGDCAYAISDHLDALTTTLAEGDSPSEPIVLVGHSLGAILAIEFASRFPEHVRRVIVLGLPCYASPSEARAYIGAHGDWLARLVVANGRLARLACAAIHTVPTLSARAAVALARTFPPEVAVDTIAHTWESYSRTLQNCILDHDVTPTFVGLSSVPVLAIHGMDDPAAPLEAVETLIDSMPNARLRILPGKHHLFLERNEACIDAILWFLSQHDGGG
ncbi:MAG: alpha/beta fold hydrolase [Thermomicrobiales bacterium]